MLKEIEDTENRLSLKRIDRRILLELGHSISLEALQAQLPIVVDIRLDGLCVYHFAAENTSPNTAAWVERKRTTVDFFGHSTSWVQAKLNGDASLFSSKYALDPMQVTLVPGGFPLCLEGFGKVGTLCVGGLKPEEDHRLVVEALERIAQR